MNIAIGLIAMVVAWLAYRTMTTRKEVIEIQAREARRVEQMLGLGMNRPSFPMCSPSRQPITDIEDWRNISHEQWLERMRNSAPIPAPEWMLPKKEKSE